MGAHVQHSDSLLLALPDVLLKEVLSWSHDTESANALLNACHATHAHRSDPAAAALLLLRQDALDHAGTLDHKGALASLSASCGGRLAVVLQLLQLLRASPDSGGPFPGSAALLQAMLQAAAEDGDAPTILSMMALPRPPSPSGFSNRALISALKNGPHLAAVDALLSCGATPYTKGTLTLAARGPAAAPALRLLLRNYVYTPQPWGTSSSDLFQALRAAMEAADLDAVSLILLPVRAAGWPMDRHVCRAARNGTPSILLLLLTQADLALQPGSLTKALCTSVRRGDVKCATILLDHGADVNGVDAAGNFEVPLVVAVVAGTCLRHDDVDRRDVVRLLLRYGAEVTQAVRLVARQGVESTEAAVTSARTTALEAQGAVLQAEMTQAEFADMVAVLQ